MKLVECIVFIVSIFLFGSVFASVAVPVGKNIQKIREVETKLERDRFIVNSVLEICSKCTDSDFIRKENDVISRCRKAWNLESFNILEMPEYFKAEWSCNDEVTVYLVKKGS